MHDALEQALLAVETRRRRMWRAGCRRSSALVALVTARPDGDGTPTTLAGDTDGTALATSPVYSRIPSSQCC